MTFIYSKAFPMQCWSNAATAIQDGQATANANGAPVAILERDGWYAVCEEPPDDMEPCPFDEGWTDYALVDPQGADGA